MTFMNRLFGAVTAAAFLATVAPSMAHADDVVAVRSAPKANPAKPKQQLGRPAFAVRSAPKVNPVNPKQQQGRRVAV